MCVQRLPRSLLQDKLRVHPNVSDITICSARKQQVLCKAATFLLTGSLDCVTIAEKKEDRRYAR